LPLESLRLIGPRRSRWLRILVAVVVVVVAAWLVSWRAYGWYHLLAGNRCLKADHCSEALTHFRAASAIWPTDETIYFLTARSARRAGDLNAADHLLRECRSPSLAEAVGLERVLLRACQGEVDAVADVCHALLRDNHPDTPLILEALAVGNVAILRFGEASAYLDRWLEIAPDQPQATFLKGRLQLQANNQQEAQTLLSRTVELDPERDDARLLLASLYLDLGQAQEALPHLVVVRKHQPGNVVAEGRMAQALILLGRSAEAVPLLDDVLRKQPENAAALLERGKLALRDEQWEQAEQWLQEACKVSPGNRAAHYQLLQCLKQRDKVAEASAAQARLDQIDQDGTRMNEIVTVELPKNRFDPELYAELGELLMDVGAISDGLKWLNRALQLDAKQSRAHRMLAAHYQAMGQRQLAEQHRAFVRQDQAIQQSP
jgi:tetratricopeptide (TPR) repeat protein